MQNDLGVTEFFKANNYFFRIYNLISEIYLSNQFSEIETLFLLNFLVNISTESAYHLVIENKLFYESNSTIYNKNISISAIQSLLEEKYKKLINYIIIKNPYYLEMVFLFLYDLKLETGLRNFYFFIFNEMVQYSTYNSQLLARETFVEKLYVMLRIEMNFNLKCLIANFLINILGEHMNISRVKSMVQTMRYNYYWADVLNMFSKLKDEKYKANFFDYDNFYITLKLLFNVMQRIISS